MTRPDYSPKDRPSVAPIAAVLTGLVLAAVAIACVVLYMEGVPLR